MTTAPILEDPQEFIELARHHWLVTPRGNRLHSADITEEHWAGIAEEWAITDPVQLACGRWVNWIGIPGVLSRMGVERCRACCRATGLPEGTGSPKNDQACRAILGLPRSGA